MERDELLRSILLILFLLLVALVVDQGRRNCDIPGSSFLPCISFRELVPRGTF
jgi:hypothetical protein